MIAFNDQMIPDPNTLHFRWYAGQKNLDEKSDLDIYLRDIF